MGYPVITAARMGLRMEKINFTKAAVEGLKATDTRREVWDTNTRGLCVRVSPTGTKTFQVVKKLHGKMKRITLGKHPDLTVEQARKKAISKISDIVYKEIDPNQEARNRRAQNLTLADVFRDYKDASKLRPSTLAGYKLAIERDLKDWKDKQLHAITGLMVQKRHKKLGKESETSANRTMRVLRALFNFARDQYENSEGRSLFPDNPTRKLKRQWNNESRRKGHIGQHQLSDWFKAVQGLPESLKRGDGARARDYLIFVLLTGLRRREASSLLWRDVDLKARRFIVRDPKNHDELWMPIPDYLVDMLEVRKKEAAEGEDRPFPIAEPKKFVERVRNLSGVYFTVHDLRRSFITVAESLDIGVFTIKALVNHRSGSSDVTEGYVQINTERLREPMTRICNFILTAGDVRKGADIVELKKESK
jgi:integrase